MSASLPPVLLQLPFLRCLVMGRASVAVFAILSGYVNALKPLKQTRAGDIDAALSGVAKSAFRRTGRFMIPAIVATTLSWLVCQFGGYNLARTVDSAWIRDTSPIPSTSFAAALSDLFSNLATTWTDGGNQYDRIQWTLCYLLRGSMLVYLTLFATAYVQPKFRILIYAIMYMYYWKAGDGETPIYHSRNSTNSALEAVIGTNIYAGLALAELSLDSNVQSFITDRPIIVSLISSTFIIFGLYVVSYPEENPEWARWSMGLMNLGHYIFPQGSEYARFYPGLGSDLLTFGVAFNTTAKRLLSHSALCWMGKMSFAIYLLHAPLIRTVLTWMLFGISPRPPPPLPGQNLPPEWIPIISHWAVIIIVPLFYIILYRIAQMWVLHVDPWCGRVTSWIEDRVFREESKAEKPGSMA